jgi:para-nitrobenzyl esterase
MGASTVGASPALGGRLRATHPVEIPFVFDNTHIPRTMTSGGAEVKALAAQTIDAWIAFARSGNPSHKGLPTWPAYATRTTRHHGVRCTGIESGQ